jgi:hypothetical protein
MTTTRGTSIAAAAALAAALAGSALAAPAAAQERDGRWQPWAGCWEASAPAGSGAEEGHVVCIVPEGTAALLVTYAGGAERARTRLAPGTGVQEATSGECTVRQAATWSADGHRLFLRGSTACGGYPARQTSGVLAMTSGAGWVDIQGMELGADEGIRVRRYHAAAPAAVRAAGAADAAAMARAAAGGAQPPVAGAGMPLEIARATAARALAPRDVAEAAGQVSSQVLQALVLERSDPFHLDGRALVALARAGVPGEVTDLMVALSHPERFEVAGGGHIAAAPPAAPAPAAAFDQRGRIDDCHYAVDRYGRRYDPTGRCRAGYSVLQRSGWSAYDYGYAPFGYGDPYGWYARPVYRQPLPIVEIERPQPAGGRVIRSRGYSSEPRPAGGRSAPADGGQGSVTPSSGSSGGTVSGRGTTRSEERRGTGRTARPRSGGGEE